MSDDDKKLMAYAQAIFDHCVGQGCSNCIFRGEHIVCTLNYPEIKWDRNVFEVRK